jgi:hypothetical protein
MFALSRIIAAATLCLCCTSAWASPQTTTTTLAITVAGTPVSTVARQTVIALTATVVSGSTPVTTGLVKFCDATATYCEDIHILGTAQLTSAGVATFKFVPGVGSRSYKAVFAGTNSYVTSNSTTSALTVTGLYPTVTAITSSGSPGRLHVDRDCHRVRATERSPGRDSIFP